MRLSTKHANQQTIQLYDFSGGLNTSNAEEMIGQNELSKAINVEIDPSTRLLRTVQGTKRIFTSEGKAFTDFAYSVIADLFLIVDADKNVYTLKRDGTDFTQVGTLTGSALPCFADWEDGMMIMSGGKPQYYHDGTLETITDSEEDAEESETNKVPNGTGVFVKDGRIYTYHDDILRASAVGDEHNWKDDSNDESSAKWLEVGYKDGGHIVGICNLSQDILIFKSNGHAYRLSGTYPNWTLSEIGRNIDVRSEGSCCALANSAIALGRNTMQAITTTQTYGDMRADDIALKVRSNIAGMPGKVKVRYVPYLNQIWMITGLKTFLFFDANCNGFFQRQYNTAVLDVVNLGKDIYVLKKDGVCQLVDDELNDDEYYLAWAFRTKAFLSHNQYLIKRVIADITPYSVNKFGCDFTIGKVLLTANMPSSANCIYHNYDYIFGNHQQLYLIPQDDLYVNSEVIYNNREYIYGNEMYLVNATVRRSDLRCVDREKIIRVKAAGYGGQILFNTLIFDFAEV